MELNFTGERLVPDKCQKNSPLFLEHITRYMFAERFMTDKCVLDAGCGCGYGTNLLAQSASKVIGIDVSKDAVNYCNSNYRKSNVDFLEMDCLNLKFPDQTFDVVVSFELIEHIHDHVSFVGGISRILKNNGIFIVSTPNKNDRSVISAKNKYHVAELAINDFKKLLTDHFGGVSLHGQRISPSFYQTDFVFKKIINIDNNLCALRANLPHALAKSLVPKFIKKNIKAILNEKACETGAKYHEFDIPMSISDIEINSEMVDDLEKYTFFIGVCRK
jgi:SAM-dependent methyltransferase